MCVCDFDGCCIFRKGFYLFVLVIRVSLFRYQFLWFFVRVGMYVMLLFLGNLYLCVKIGSTQACGFRTGP